MVRVPPPKKRSKGHPGSSRLTVSLPAVSYREVQLMAKRNQVSAAWIIRKAVDEYIQKDIPLFYPAPPQT